jgi:O-acetyl-ADP-ribose deacetylase (regulator of RNase III)
MIEYVTGNLLNADAEALVNAVNTVGVMGKGIALQFRLAFPENYNFYRKACKRNEVVPGKMLVFVTGTLTNPRYIINFPTKRHWKSKSRIEDIKYGLQDLLKVVINNQIQSIAVPPLGCGYGGLKWEDVRPMIEAAFAPVPDVKVQLFTPEDAPNTNQDANG